MYSSSQLPYHPLRGLVAWVPCNHTTGVRVSEAPPSLLMTCRRGREFNIISTSTTAVNNSYVSRAFSIVFLKHLFAVWIILSKNCSHHSAPLSKLNDHLTTRLLKNSFTDGDLLFATGPSPDPIQKALDRRARTVERFGEHPSYRKLVDKLGTDNNVLVAFSLDVFFKTSFLPLFEEFADDPVQQILSTVFMNLPDSYSVGFSAKARHNSIDANLFLSLGDLKQLTQMLGAIFQMGQME